MVEQHTVEPTDDELMVEIGDVVVLTEGQGKGSSEDKRRAYNS
ncbi:albusnodin family lasso peptide [Kitasatospora sp. NPDC058201]|nr:albusnodin family lasso peptide [Streptomyces sp. BE303]MED7952863.1 albusnodin family lasso peptide [Streptomyces sp. BE303]